MDKKQIQYLKKDQNRVNQLNNEASGIRDRLQGIEENRTNILQNNRQFNQAHQQYEDQIVMLEQDKQSLMKRLNLVLSELEQATHEKSDISSKLRYQEGLADDLKRKLDEVSSIKNVVNKNLQEDLRYERDLNDKLRVELDRFQSEKDSMLVKLREQEATREDIARETTQINATLLRKNDELRKLENEHENNCHRLRDLNDQLELMRQRTLNSQTQKRRLEEDLRLLSDERDDLVRKMNELNLRYEDYVSSMNEERDRIIRTNKTHVRLLTAKLLFQILGQALDMRAKQAIQEIKYCAKDMLDLEKRIKKFVKVMKDYITERKRNSLRRWYRHAMNFVHENYKNQNLIRFNVNKKIKTQFFYQWRRAYLLKERSKGHQMDGINVLRRFTESQEARTLRRFICHWRDVCLKKESQQDYLFRILQRKSKMTRRRAFINWLAFSKKQSLEERYEHMSELITQMWFKQKIFLALKLEVMKQQSETEIVKFKAWKSWCENSRKEKYFRKKEILIEKIEGTRTEMLMKKVFDSIRYSNINDKFESTRQELEDKIPIRQELERQKEELIKMSNQKDKSQLFRNFMKRYQDVMYRFLQIWKERCAYHNHNMDRVKLRLINLHKQNLSKAMFKWKEYCDKKHLQVLAVHTEDLQNENQNLQNTLNVQKERQKVMAVRSSNRKISKLERVRNMINRIMIKKRFKQWVDSSQYIINIEDGVVQATKIMLKRKLRNNFQRYLKKVKELKKEEQILKRVAWFSEKRESIQRNELFQMIKIFTKRIKLAKKFLIRSSNGLDKQLLNQGFANWKQMCSKKRQKLYTDNIQELNRRKNDHEEQIQKFKVQIEKNESKQKHLVSKMQQQAHRIMGNFIVRMNSRQIARGYYKWFDVVNQENQKRRFLKKAVLYWHRRTQACQFRKWAETSFKIREQELSEILDKEEQKKRELQKKREQEEKSHAKEAQELQNQVSEQTALKEQLNNNFERAFNTLVRRVKDNHYIDKRRNILLVWRDFIKAEKNAVNVIGAIARRTLRMEVFQRIRLVARENYLDKDANRKMNHFFRCVKNNVLMKAMVTWRKNSYAECVRSMVETEQAYANTLEENDKRMSNILKAKHQRAERIIRLKKLRSNFNILIDMIKQLKTLRVKQEVLQKNVKFLKQRESLRKIFKRTQVTIYMRKRTAKLTREWNLKLMKTCLEAIKQNLKAESKFIRKFLQVCKRSNNLDLAKSFQHWHHTAQSMGQRENEAIKHGSRSIAQILDRLLKRRIQSALYSLKNRSQNKDFKERFLKRALVHVAEYRVKHFFHKWAHNVDRLNLGHIVNTEGDVVLERNQAQRNAKRLREELINSGYTPEHIDEYLAKKSELQRSNMQKAVVGLFFKNTDFNIIPKALNQWKEWVKSRKRVKENARFILNCLNHPLTIYFKKWKYEKADAEKVLDKLSKKQLIDKIVADENLIGSSKSRIQRMDQAIDHLNIQRDNLLEHFIKGQRLALAKINNNYLATVFRSFARWKKSVQTITQLELTEQLDRTNAMISELSEHVGKLDSINKNLLVENEELRSAALDGIEIAKAVQDLTKEREALSSDLQNRATTIKKLIEENNNLSLRLSIAQKEAGLN